MDNKELLQKDIETKTKELDVLKSKILSETEDKNKQTLEQQKIKLEEEIHVLQNQLDELKKLETSATTNQTAKEAQALKDTIEVDNDWSYEIIKWTKMYDKLLLILWSEAKVETFALEIDAVVRKYLDQELVWFSNSIKNSMSVGIQFAMMETLIKQWADWSAQFFDTFSRVKSKSGTKAFEWLYSAFGTLWSANEFFVLANKVQNLTWYLSDKKSTITHIENIPELMNPNQFKLLLSNPVWSVQTQIDALDISKILTLNSSTAVDIHAWENELKNIINNDAITGVITEKTIQAIQKSLQTADKLLDTRGKIKSKASTLVDTIAWFLDINIPFLGNLWELAGLEFPTDVLWERKDWWVLNFVLGVLGFRGGLKWLHKEYIQEKLDELHIDNAFILAASTVYQKNIDATVTHDSASSIWKTCSLVAPDPTIEAAMKSKIPTDYLGLKKSIVDTIDTATLNPTMVAKFAPQAIVSGGDQSTVDMTKVKENKGSFVDEYLKYIIPLLADPSDDFITSQNIDQNSFVLAVIGGLVGDKYFIEAINLWILSSRDFVAPVETPPATQTPSTSPENIATPIGENDPELLRLATWPNESYSTNTKFVQYLHTLEQNNGLPYGIMLNLMITESWGKLYRADWTTIVWSWAGAKWLFQFMPETAKHYIVKLWYTVAEYEKIYTNPIIWAKACAQFLKDCKDAWDDAVNILAHYNAWPWVLASKKITSTTLSALPKETQKYITQTWSAMLQYSNKQAILTESEINNPSSIPPNTLENFLLAVNALPAPQETAPDVVPNVDIVAETIAETTWFGDSSMEWLYLAGLKNSTYYRWLSTQELLEKLDDSNILNNIHKYPSCIISTWYNDIAKKLPDATTKTALEAIITKLKPSTQAVLSTLVYVQDKTILPDKEVDRINGLIKKVAIEQKCPLIDHFAEVQASDIAYAWDGLHLKNYTPIFNNIKEHVETPSDVA